jgi:predicted transcriptional regulator
MITPGSCEKLSPCGFFYAKAYLRYIPVALMMPTFKHRARLTVFAEILKVTRESSDGRKKTDIMRSVNLNHPQADKYLNLLLTNNLLCLDNEDRYKPTKKGLKLVKTLESLNLRLK